MIKAILIDISGVILGEDELNREFLRAAKDILKQSGTTLTDGEIDKVVKQWVFSFEQSSFF